MNSRIRIGLLGLTVVVATYFSALIFLYFSGAKSTARHHLESTAALLIVAGVSLAALSRSRTPVRPAKEPSRHLILTAAVAGAIGAAILLRSVGYGFFSDDYALLKLARTADWLGTSEFVRPVPLFLWRLLAAVSMNPAAFHLLNITLHFCNAYCVWRLACSLGFRSGGAVCAAVLFLVFPGSLEAIVWPSGVQDVLMTSAALLACVFALGKESLAVNSLLVVLTALAIGTKETGAAVPLLVVIVLWIRDGSRGVWTSAGAVIATVVGAAIALAVRLFYRAADSGLFLRSRYDVKEFLVRPIAYLGAPVHVEWARDHAVLPTTLIVILVFAFVRAARDGDLARRWHRYAGCLLWIYVSVLPLQRFFYVSDHLGGGRYLYLPAVGWSLLLSAVVVEATSERHVSISGVGLVATILAGFLLLVSNNLSAWEKAAALRDQLVRSARESIENSGCRSAVFTGVPDTVDGAQVLQNGFAVATGLPLLASGTARDSCTFTWTGDRFERH